MDILSSFSIPKSLFDSLLQLSSLSNILSDLITSSAQTPISGQIELLESIYAIRYSLLKSLNFSQDFKNYSVSAASKETSATELVDETLRVGALLYMQTTMQEFPVSALGSRRLVQRLKETITKFHVNDSGQENFLVWLLFVGGVEAKDDDRTWFVKRLREVLNRLGCGLWKETREILERLWWVRQIHEKRFIKLWEEVEESTTTNATQ